ncbi:MAG: Cellulosome-anchoring protein precursor [Pelotomaculum sp. PtaB.Bin013]|uniref:S-layer homology domain-containing protein n=1 Tax=Pelotomaculum isophthalicicum JI TaxID=947010 RepID=A0A9X4H0I0_9FIRM|nr:S-layer homology domain-containing protein [Pelotomaculum isophthalicicum]MDF9406766.1 S-layer homology domain-containing protein [Pelotomaculum isophthalicicum JI]OPX89707.1 MAG: Cellulosome-anchoring protein precursor [Pelotomaculum sp. PtaB.Bin013]
MIFKKTIVLLVVLSFLLVFPAVAGARGDTDRMFNDVEKEYIDYPFIKYLWESGVIAGFPDGTFRPGENITRAQAAKVLVLAGGLTATSSSSEKYFADMDENHWAYGMIQSAAGAGLLMGYPDGNFRPEQPVSRAELATLLLRFGNTPRVNVELPELADMNATHWAAYPVGVVLKAGLLGLSGKDAFAPEEPATRSDMARGLALIKTLSPDLRKVQLAGKLAVKKNGVFLLPKDTQTRHPVSEAVLLSVGDTIIVDQNGEAEIVFEDGSGIRINPNTELEIKKLDGFLFLRTDGTTGSAVDRLEIKLKKGVIHGALASRYNEKEEKAAPTTSLKKMQPGYGMEAPGNPGEEGLAPVLLAYKGVDTASVYSGLYAAGEQEEQAGPAEEVAWWQEPYEQRTRVVVDMPWGVAAIRSTFWTNWVTSDSQGTNVLVGQAVVSVGGRQVVVDLGMSFKIADPLRPPELPAKMTEDEKKEWAEIKSWVQERVEKILKEVAQNLSANPQVTLVQKDQVVTTKLETLTPEQQNAIIEQELQTKLNQITNEITERYKGLFKETGLDINISGPGTSANEQQQQQPQQQQQQQEQQPVSSGGGGGHSSSPVDTVAPTVTATSPVDGTTGVAVNSSITVTFSEEIRGVNENTFTLKRSNDNSVVAASVFYDAAKRTATLVPAGDLAAGTRYSVVLTGGITDTAGNALASYTFYFTTAEGITVTTELNFIPAMLNITAGDTFSVDVVAKNVQDLYGVDLEVLYDPALAEAQYVVSGAAWNEEWAFVQNGIDNKSGKISMILTRKKPYGGCNGLVTIGTVVFKSLSPGALRLSFSSQHDLCNSIPEFIVHQVSACDVDILR